MTDFVITTRTTNGFANSKTIVGNETLRDGGNIIATESKSWYRKDYRDGRNKKSNKKKLLH